MNGDFDELQESEDELFKQVRDRAYRSLLRREHSAWELRRKLKHQAPSHLLEKVISDLQSRNEQSDYRFAEMLCRSRFNSGKGPIKILNEFREHQIESDIVENVMAEFEDQWSALAAEVKQSKFGVQPAKSFKEWSKHARFMQQRGFDISHIGQYDESFEETE